MQDILNIQRRFFRSEKNLFLNAIGEQLTQYGIEFERKQFGKILKSENLETKCDNPDYIFVAHYDTGTTLPIWYEWIMKRVGINRQLLIIVLLIAFMHIATGLLEGLIPSSGSYLNLALALSMFTMFIPNKKNFDDNTSGVITLLKLAKKLKVQGINNVKIIFVDNEELGLWGSAAHAKCLKKNNLISKDYKIISVDCVGGTGEIPLIIRNGSCEYAAALNEEISQEFGLCREVNMLLPASDNYSFKNFGALNLSFVTETVIPGGYYIENIHSSKDSALNFERMEKVSDVLSIMVAKTTGSIEMAS